MARKNWRVNSEIPSRLGPSSNDLPPETLGLGCNKRVRFTDLHTSNSRDEDTRSGDPKTSEYASFKKLKEDAHRFHSNLLRQDKTQSLNLKESHHSRERSITENKDKDMRPLLPKNVTPDHLFTYVSTPDNASCKSVVDMKRAGTTTTDTSKMQENMHRYEAPSKNAGVFSRKRHKLNQLVAKTLSLEVEELFSKGHDIVSMLLRKLFPETNKNKSSDDLKARALEKDTKSRSLTSPEFNLCNNFQWTPERNFMELEGTPSLDVGFPSYWSEFRKTKKIPKPNFLNCYPHGTFIDNREMELDYERATPVFLTQGDSAFDLDIRRHEHLTSRHLKELDEFHYSVQPLHGQERQTLLLGWDVDNMADESNLSTDSHNTKLSLHPFVSSLYGDDQQKNPFEGYTAKEVHYPIESLHKLETSRLLLDWTEDNIVDKSNFATTSQNTELSFNCFLPSSHGNDQLDDSSTDSRLCMKSLVSYCPPTSQSTELSLNCFLSSLPGDDQKRKLDDSFAESRLFTESLVSYHPPNLLPLQFSSSATDKCHAEDDVFANNIFSSCLPDTTNQLNMRKSSNYDITCNGSDTFLSSLNQLWFMRRILNERQHYPDRVLPSSGFDFYIEPEFKPASGLRSDHCLYSWHALECPQSEHLSSYLNGDTKERYDYDLSHRGISKNFENVTDTHNWSSNYFQFALDKEKSYPLLLSKSYWDDKSYDERCGLLTADRDGGSSCKIKVLHGSISSFFFSYSMPKTEVH
ncbi:hypothetical protein M5689_019247 [Euphorbia peplus]|nr:hypothetical protein M5689_019247 [Euphorbia peplus]